MFLTLASILMTRSRNLSWTSTGTIRARKRSMRMAKRTSVERSMSPNKCSIHWQNTSRYAFILDDWQRTSDCVFQGPCPQNQLALANSRLWDAIAGFLYIFAHMQRKLSQVLFPFPLFDLQDPLDLSIDQDPMQIELLRELMKLQKDMIIMLLSMLEGKFDFWSAYELSSRFSVLFV